jgi:hypothetical protein
MEANAMAYRYKMIQIPPKIVIKPSEEQGGPAAAYLEKVVSEQARQGWEFYRVDAIGVRVEPGCLASLFGQGTKEDVYYVITFRQEV